MPNNADAIGRVLDLGRLPPPTIMLVDDQRTGRVVLAEIVRGLDPRVNVVSFDDPEKVLEFVRGSPVDLLITDYLMPGMDGIELTRKLRKLHSQDELPIVMTTVARTRDVLYRAFDAGVSDFLLRPVDPLECRLRCEALLKQRSRHLATVRHVDALSARLERIRAELNLAEEGWLQRLSEFRAQPAGEQASSERVASYAGLIATRMGCAPPEVELLQMASSVHDIGALGLPLPLLAEDVEFSREQRCQLQRHTVLGHRLLSGSASRLLGIAADIALHHHERLDGTGYPRGLKGAQISFMARIVAVADVFNALVSPRCYRHAMSPASALDCLRTDMRAKLDQDAVGALADATQALSPAGLVAGRPGKGNRHV